MNPVKDALLWASDNPKLAATLPRWRFVERTVARFMPGPTADEAIRAAAGLAAQGVPTSFTVLGEHVTDLAQATAATGEYLRLLDRIDETGLDAEVSVKLTQLGYDLDLDHTRMQVQRLAERSAELGRTVWIDMESLGYVDGTLDIYEGLLVNGHDVGLCMQAYLRRTWDDLQRLLPNRPSIRLVKGAYRESPEHVFTARGVIDEAYLRLAMHMACDAPCSAPTTCRWSSASSTGSARRGAIDSRSRCCSASAPTTNSDWPETATRSARSSRSVTIGTRGSCAGSPRSPWRTRCSRCGTSCEHSP